MGTSAFTMVLPVLLSIALDASAAAVEVAMMVPRIRAGCDFDGHDRFEQVGLAASMALGRLCGGHWNESRSNPRRDRSIVEDARSHYGIATDSRGGGSLIPFSTAGMKLRGMAPRKCR